MSSFAVLGKGPAGPPGPPGTSGLTISREILPMSVANAVMTLTDIAGDPYTAVPLTETLPAIPNATLTTYDLVVTAAVQDSGSFTLAQRTYEYTHAESLFNDGRVKPGGHWTAHLTAPWPEPKSGSFEVYVRIVSAISQMRDLYGLAQLTVERTLQAGDWFWEADVILDGISVPDDIGDPDYVSYVTAVPVDSAWRMPDPIRLG